jgi:hypothetical protein
LIGRNLQSGPSSILTDGRLFSSGQKNTQKNIGRIRNK